MKKHIIEPSGTHTTTPEVKAAFKSSIEEPLYECSDLLANLLENLRAEQKGFFASQPGTLTRQQHLQESKRLEKELDKFLQQRKEEKEKLPDLFS